MTHRRPRGQGPDLFTTTREHDLPPRWDGRIVLWEGWHPTPPMFICPPTRKPAVCPACGSTAERLNNRGLLAHNRRITMGMLAGRAAHGQLGKVAVWTLHASRCPDCRHDQVWDQSADVWWELDPDDYTGDGSDDPTAPTIG